MPESFRVETFAQTPVRGRWGESTFYSFLADFISWKCLRLSGWAADVAVSVADRELQLLPVTFFTPRALMSHLVFGPPRALLLPSDRRVGSWGALTYGPWDQAPSEVSEELRK